VRRLRGERRVASGDVQAIVYVVGARPNFPKMAPVERELRARLPDLRHLCVHTGQHYDHALSDIFLSELELPEPAYVLGVGSGTHGRQTARALERVEEVLIRERPVLVLVAGDVNSTLAAALAAVKLGIAVGHVEAGLRSFDRTMPEEVNRVLVDQISELCFVHSAEAVENLRREGVADEHIVFAGNTMIDTLVRVRPASERSHVHARLGLARGDYLLVTLHRPALVDGPLLERVVTRLEALAAELPVVFPVHPRTRARLGERDDGRLRLIEPLGYVDFLALEAHAAAVLTDSGGIQEETTFLGVPCFTLRDSTERPVTVTEGTNLLLGLDPDAIRSLPELLTQTPRPLRPPRGWDGHAAERVADAVAGWLGADAELAHG
jgi:UDP-N-acetylglucosamine 2-epimerase (non-hydrolysing)